MLQHGVTAFCPTVITSQKDFYSRALPLLKPRQGGVDGAACLGAHLEGPFMSDKKYGCHPPELILSNFQTNKLEDVYGDDFTNVCIVTLAPELDGALEAVRVLNSKRVAVSMVSRCLLCVLDVEYFIVGATFDASVVVLTLMVVMEKALCS